MVNHTCYGLITHDSYISVHPDSHNRAVLQCEPLLESPLFNWEEEGPSVFSSSENCIDGWSPVREWPDRPLPKSAAGELSPKLKAKLEENLRKQVALLKSLGCDVDYTVDLEQGAKQPPVPIALGDRVCLKCGKSFYNHYLCTLH